ncbi:MAG: hypothetical protein ACTSUE_10065 [Promethearchaeota archaeon]
MNLFEKLHRGLIPAIPTWFKKVADGHEIAYNLNKNYVSKLIAENIEGVAVLVHTGRGNYLLPEEKRQYLSGIVDLCHESDKLVVTGAQNKEDALMARELGVDVILIFPHGCGLSGPDDPDRREKIISYHDEISSAHGNGCAFLLYKETGIGMDFTPDELLDITNLKSIHSIKFALLSNFERYEDYLTLLKQKSRNLVFFTGEDRMFAESIEKARDLNLQGWQRAQDARSNKIGMNALIGLGSALPNLQAFMLKTYDMVEYQEEYFHARAIISKLARYCFVRPRVDGFTRYDMPMEGYITNMALASGFQFNIPSNAIPDLALISREREQRGIPRVIWSAIDNNPGQYDHERILETMEAGLKMEKDIKSKYGRGLEKILGGSR